MSPFFFINFCIQINVKSMFACFFLQVFWSTSRVGWTRILLGSLLSLSIDFLNNEDKFLIIENLYNRRFISRSFYSSLDELFLQQTSSFFCKIFILILLINVLQWNLLIRLTFCLDNKLFFFAEAKESIVGFILWTDFQTIFWLKTWSLLSILFLINRAMRFECLFCWSLLWFQPKIYNNS